MSQIAAAGAFKLKRLAALAFLFAAGAVFSSDCRAQLPQQGQIWKEYNIASYTQGVTNTSRPEQTVMDAILRQTGHQAWCGEIPGMLNVGPQSVRVYHTPEMQQQVEAIINQYLQAGSKTVSWQFRVMTVNNPAWRTRAVSFLRAAETQSPGTSAWILSGADVPALMQILQDRNDFQQVNSPQVTMHNGQPATINLTHPRNYIRGIYADPDRNAGFRPAEGLIEEGCKIEFTPLVSADGKTIDAVVETHIDNIEKVYDVNLPFNSNRPGAPRSVKVQVPRIDQYRFQERFIWAADRALLISLGITPSPIPERGSLAPGLPLFGAERVETLILILKQP